jgi:hypothetical protein
MIVFLLMRKPMLFRSYLGALEVLGNVALKRHAQLWAACGEMRHALTLRGASNVCIRPRKFFLLQRKNETDPPLARICFTYCVLEFCNVVRD